MQTNRSVDTVYSLMCFIAVCVIVSGLSLIMAIQVTMTAAIAAVSSIRAFLAEAPEYSSPTCGGSGDTWTSPNTGRKTW